MDIERNLHILYRFWIPVPVEYAVFNLVSVEKRGKIAPKCRTRAGATLRIGIALAAKLAPPPHGFPRSFPAVFWPNTTTVTPGAIRA